LPLKKAGLSRLKSFMYGQFSGFVEVIGALLGATMVYFVGAILPYALSFAAGAMIYVVVKELIPRSQSSGKTVGNIGIIAGFCVMMTMEVAL
jgi:ZIP family zinc transporter